MIPNSVIQRRNRRAVRKGMCYFLMFIVFLGFIEWVASSKRVKPVDNPYSYFNMK